LPSAPAPSGGGLGWGLGAAKTAEADDQPGFWDKARSAVGLTEAVAAGVAGKVKKGVGDVVDFAADGIGSGLDLAGDVVSGAAARAGDGVAAAGDWVGDGVETIQAGWGSVVGSGYDLVGDAAELGLDLVGDGMRSRAEAGASVLELVGMDRLGEALELAGASADRALDLAGAMVDERVDERGEEVESFIRGGGEAANALLTGGARDLGRGIAIGGQAVDATLDLSALGWDVLGDALEGLMDRSAAKDFLAADAWLQLTQFDVKDRARDKDVDRLYGGVELLQEAGNQLSEYGIPLTDAAWDLQRLIDGGKLEQHYKQSVVSTLVEAGVVDLSELGVDALPASFQELERGQLQDWIDIIESKVGSGEALLDALPDDVRHDLQEAVIHAYVEEANQHEGATFILELLPTDTDNLRADMGHEGADWLLHDQLPDGFVPSEKVLEARDTALGVSTIQGGPDNTFALPVPYANSVPNVMLRDLVPTDGAHNLQALLGLIDDGVTTVGTGYSQGAAALNEAVRQQGEDSSLPTLDYAVSLAAMGGADMAGGEGWYAGQTNGTQMFSAVHAEDPARYIHTDQSELMQLLSLVNFKFADGERRLTKGDGDLHGKTCADVPEEEACALDPVTQQPEHEGTLGYPAGRLEEHLQDLFDGKHSNEEFERQGSWIYNIVEQLVRLREGAMLAREGDAQGGRPLG
jgi:hypothetical protein